MPSRPSPTLSFDEPTQQSRPWGATEAFDPAGSRDGPGHTWREHSGRGRGAELSGRLDAYSITSLVRARIEGGIIRPRPFAVVTLTSNSKVAACWTGSSPGGVPLRILAT